MATAKLGGETTQALIHLTDLIIKETNPAQLKKLGAEQKRLSKTLKKLIDKVVPDPARVLYDRLQETIAGGDFPTVFGDLTPTRARQVEAPDPALLASPALFAISAARTALIWGSSVLSDGL